MSKKFLQTSSLALGLGLAIASATTLCSTAAEALTLDLGQDVYGQIHDGSVNVSIRNRNDSVFADAKNISKQLVEFNQADDRHGTITWDEMVHDNTPWVIAITTTVEGFNTEHAHLKVSPSDLVGIKGVDTEKVNDVLNKLTLTLHDCKHLQDFQHLTCTVTGSMQ